MSGRAIFQPLFIGGFVLAAAVLGSCGGDSDGDLIIEGTLIDGSTARVDTPVENFVVVGLADTDVTDGEGNFSIKGDAENLPSQTLLTFTAPTGQTGTLVVSTSGIPPFRIIVASNSDGTFTSTDAGIPQVPSDSPQPIPSPEAPQEEVPELPPVDPTVFPTFTPSAIPESDGGFSEAADCFCNDGFGPVAPSFTCGDTGRHPSDCIEPTPTAG